MSVVSINGPALRRLRMENLLTQRDLAVKAGVRPETISRVENGKPAAFDTARRLAAALEVMPALIVRYDG